MRQLLILYEIGFVLGIDNDKLVEVMSEQIGFKTFQGHRPRVKFCGMTRTEDVRFAVKLGVDAIGLIMVPNTARGLSPQAAKRLRDLVPSSIACVCVVQNPSVAIVNQIQDEVAPDFIQFHGQETNEFCEQFSQPYWKALAVKDQASLARTQDYALAHTLLLDGWTADGAGGHGVGFDWSLLTGIAKQSQQQFALAGGLAPCNIALTRSLIQQGCIDLLDVSSGTEHVGTAQQKGIKSHARMQAFMAEVQALRQ